MALPGRTRPSRASRPSPAPSLAPPGVVQLAAAGARRIHPVGGSAAERYSITASPRSDVDFSQGPIAAQFFRYREATQCRLMGHSRLRRGARPVLAAFTCLLGGTGL